MIWLIGVIAVAWLVFVLVVFQDRAHGDILEILHELEGDADATVEHRAIIGLIREDVAALRDVVNQSLNVNRSNSRQLEMMSSSMAGFSRQLDRLDDEVSLGNADVVARLDGLSDFDAAKQ